MEHAQATGNRSPYAGPPHVNASHKKQFREDRSVPESKFRDITVRVLGSKQKSPTCFRSQERHLCDETDCEWRHDCRRLVAEWRR